MHRPNRKHSTLILALGVSAAVLYFNASMAINEVGFVRSGFPGDAYLPQEPAIKRVVEEIPKDARYRSKTAFGSSQPAFKPA